MRLRRSDIKYQRKEEEKEEKKKKREEIKNKFFKVPVIPQSTKD
jgi:hypothetical protein